MLKHFLRNNSGSALVELALTTPLLLGVLLGVAEIGRIAYAAIEVQSSARAGAAYAAQNPGTAFGSTTGGSPVAAIELAAQNDASNITDLTFPTAPTQACVCETNYASGATPTFNSTTPVSCTASAISSCPAVTSTSTSYVVEYVVVNTQATVKTMFHYPGIPTSFTLNGTAQMRVLQN
jgi:Flp pilus assembly protein TadG